MTPNESTASIGPHPAASRPSHAKLIAWLLCAALAVLLAAWLAAVLATPSIGSAFTKPHPGFPAEVIPGGAIVLVQLAVAVVVSFVRSRSRNSG